MNLVRPAMQPTNKPCCSPVATGPKVPPHALLCTFPKGSFTPHDLPRIALTRILAKPIREQQVGGCFAHGWLCDRIVQEQRKPSEVQGMSCTVQGWDHLRAPDEVLQGFVHGAVGHNLVGAVAGRAQREAEVVRHAQQLPKVDPCRA